MRAAVAIAVLMLALAGCGSSDETAAAPAVPKGDFGPAEPGQGERKRQPAPELARPTAAVAQALAAGAVGVVGVEGDVGVRPRELEVSADGTLRQLEWSSWGGGSATGTGTMHLRDCDPSCASGDIDEVEAVVELSGPRLCGRATYFDRAEVSLRDAAPPTTYVRAPC